jgi:hypothetical protein
MHPASKRRRPNRLAMRDGFAPLDSPSLQGAVRRPAIVNGTCLGRRCRGCGGENFVTGPGKTPHAVALTCVPCGAFAGWLSKRKTAELAGRAAA